MTLTNTVQYLYYMGGMSGFFRNDDLRRRTYTYFYVLVGGSMCGQRVRQRRLSNTSVQRTTKTGTTRVFTEISLKGVPTYLPLVCSSSGKVPRSICRPGLPDPPSSHPRRLIRTPSVSEVFSKNGLRLRQVRSTM